MTTAKEIGQLRMPSIAGIRAAEEADVCVVSAADVNARPRALRSCRVADTGRALVCARP